MTLLQPDANHLALTVDVYRTIASLSEKTLLTVLDDLAKIHDLSAMRRFFDLVIEDKSTGPIYEEDKSISEPRISFSQVLIKPLHSQAPMGDCDPQPWGRAQVDYFDHMMKALEGHPNRVDFLDKMLFHGASKIQDPRFFTSIAESAQIPFADHWSALSISQPMSPFAEAVVHQNSAAAVALATLVQQSSLSIFVDESTRGRSSDDKDIRGVKCLTGLFGVGDRIHDIAEAMIPRLSPEDTQQLRLTMVKETLERNLEAQIPWDLDGIKRAAGGLGPESAIAQASQRLADEKLQPLRSFAGTDYGKATKERTAVMENFTMKTACTAIEAHCTPVLEAMVPLLLWAPHTPAGNPLCNGSGVSIASAISQGRYEDSDSAGKLSPGALRDTIALLMANGHSPQDLTSGGKNLAHVLGESNVESFDWTVKLVQLLDLGVDTDALSHDGELPTTSFAGDVEQWMAVVRSHSARQRAWDALDEADDNLARSPAL